VPFIFSESAEVYRVSVSPNLCFTSLTYSSLPVLSRLKFISIADKEVKCLLEKHGRKLQELELQGCYSLGDLDMCPALCILTFTLEALVTRPPSFVAGNHINGFGFGCDFDSTRFRCERKHRSLTKIVISQGKMYVNRNSFLPNTGSPSLIKVSWYI
jgi:hypothetical protein